MDWFLYDRELRHERVNSFKIIQLIQLKSFEEEKKSEVYDSSRPISKKVFELKKRNV